jgi:hypothetical protein
MPKNKQPRSERPSKPRTGPKRSRASERASERTRGSIPKNILEAAGCKTQREFVAHYKALFTGWNCSVTPRDMLGNQVMQVAVFVPDAPLNSSRGPIRAIWFGHVKPGVKTGRVAAGETFGYSYDSGIRFENNGVPNARASHVHACASATGQLSPNGDVDGLVAAELMGWTPITWVGSNGPGPQQYQSGAYCAGRPLADFRNSGHAVPPMPD